MSQKTLSVTRTSDLAFHDNVGWEFRVFLLFAGFVPLLAPYELLCKPGWESYFNPAFIVVLLFCIAAIGLSLFFFGAAVFSLNRELRFDPLQRLVIYRWSSPFIELRQQVWQFAAVGELTARLNDDTDGTSYYELTTSINGGKQLRFGKFESLELAEARKESLQYLLRTEANAAS